MNGKKITLVMLSLFVAAGVFVPASYSHADSYYVVTESQRVVRESTPPPVVVREYTPPPVVVREYTPPPVVVHEYTPTPVVVHEYTPTPIVREETIVTRPIVREETIITRPMVQQENGWWRRHFRKDDSE